MVLRPPFILSDFVKITLIGVFVGVIAGIGAIIFHAMLELSTHYFLGFAGFRPPDVSGEWSQPDPLKLLLVMTLGGLVCGLIVYTFAPEAEGHGTDEAIKAFHKKGGEVRARVPIIKMIASAITIGTGGSAGREGPIAQISAGYGSIVAKILKLTPRERRIALAVGIGAGVGSIFKAPLGGAILSAEILYKRDFETEALVPSLIASIVGYTIFCAYDGYKPTFMFPEVHILAHHIPFFILEGLICGVIGIIYVITFYKTRGLFSKFFKMYNLPYILKPASGALIACLVVVAVAKIYNPIAGYGALGMGYNFLQLAMLGLLPLSVMIVLAFVKIIATSLTIGSGGSGGVFAPGLVIGGMVGGAVGLIFHSIFPEFVTLDVVPAFVAVGMIALFGGISKAPISVLIMICEMTKNYELLLPGMAAVAVSYVVTGDYTIYSEQVNTRIDSPAHRYEMAIDLLEEVKVKDAMTRDVMTVTPDQTVGEVFRLIERTGHMGFPVLEDGKLIGIITFEDIERVPLEERTKTKVRDVMTPNPITASPDDDLKSALEKMVIRGVGRLPVVENGRLVGIITKGDIIKAYVRIKRKLGII
ncbi:chloride channel protein [Archaeoglobus profundus]|uniref:Chloride channel core n=1 Tax=Archaeoglobus profundus (strain DSM 5631 / JCM 9629 / NBRC 100127 / Av18) TaxID=572546 RepID=D2RDH4_ARCPA|nr:chloride channel protein [Archaeoglobus profundus]ADB58168.1 Chloride channel core [Archaeoglobus profundus DSM 5631]